MVLVSGLFQPPSGGCVLKPANALYGVFAYSPAAFGRLCVETSKLNRLIKGRVQPPSGGCVLKPDDSTVDGKVVRQPPSGGCVLKHRVQQKDGRNLLPAAFGRLCVETEVLGYQ